MILLLWVLELGKGDRRKEGVGERDYWRDVRRCVCADQQLDFGEVELVFEGFLGAERIAGLCEKFDVSGYKELRYGELSADSGGRQ